MVGTVGNVSSHCGSRVANGCAVLYLQTFNSVGIIAAPYLRRVIKHTRVKTCSAAGAVLQKNVGVIRGKPVHQVVNSQNVSVPKLPLTVFRQGGRTNLGKLTVHIPLDVLNIRIIKYVFHHSVNAVPDLLVGVVQNVLLAGHRHIPSSDLDSPFGVLSVKLAVGRDHLRLEPDAEFHTQFVYLVNKVFQTAFKLLFVYKPVAERAVVRVSVSEPAVVHNKHFNAKL